MRRLGRLGCLTGGYTSGLKTEAPTDVQICVLRSLREAARQALTELRAAAADEPLDED